MAEGPIDLLDLEATEDDETAGEIFKKLTQAWVNEKCCPDLLKTKNDLVDCMMDQIKQMEENLKGLTHDDFLVVPHKMEIDRIRFVISSYLRTRLEKIEAYAVFLLRRDRSIVNEEQKYMSKNEYEFAEKYWNTVKTQFHEEACRHMPTLLHQFEGLDIEVRPNMKSIITVKFLKPLEGVLIKGNPVDLEAGTYYMLPFNDVKHLIDNGVAVCI